MELRRRARNDFGAYWRHPIVVRIGDVQSEPAALRTDEPHDPFVVSIPEWWARDGRPIEQIVRDAYRLITIDALDLP